MVSQPSFSGGFYPSSQPVMAVPSMTFPTPPAMSRLDYERTRRGFTRRYADGRVTWLDRNRRPVEFVPGTTTTKAEQLAAQRRTKAKAVAARPAPTAVASSKTVAVPRFQGPSSTVPHECETSSPSVTNPPIVVTPPPERPKRPDPEPPKDPPSTGGGDDLVDKMNDSMKRLEDLIAQIAAREDKTAIDGTKPGVDEANEKLDGLHNKVGMLAEKSDLVDVAVAINQSLEGSAKTGDLDKVVENQGKLLAVLEGMASGMGGDVETSRELVLNIQRTADGLENLQSEMIVLQTNQEGMINDLRELTVQVQRNTGAIDGLDGEVSNLGKKIDGLDARQKDFDNRLEDLMVRMQRIEKGKFNFRMKIDPKTGEVLEFTPSESGDAN